MAEHLRIANAGITPRKIGDWAETETARDISRSLDLVREVEQPAMTMIAGSPGIGKTQTIKRFCAKLGRDALYIQVARGEGTVWNFAACFAKLQTTVRGYVPHFNTHAEARLLFASYLGRTFSGTRHLLIVDEAQYLNQKNKRTGQTGETFEWLRSMAETGGFDLVFCGDLLLPNAINAMPQLQSRMLRPVIIKEASRADVAAVVEGTAFANERAIDALHAIARLKGGLRNVANVTRIAQLFAEPGTPTPAHLKAAILDMKLAPRGIKL